MSLYYSPYTKPTGSKGKLLGDKASKIFSEGPSKAVKESQCVISPSLIGSLKHCLRTDDVCTASITYYLKSVNAMPEEYIRLVVALMRHPELTNHQVAARVRKLVPPLANDRQIKVRYSVTEFIMNTLDPTFGIKRHSAMSSDGRSSGPDMLDSILDSVRGLPPPPTKAKRQGQQSLGVAAGGTKPSKRSQLDVSNRAPKAKLSRSQSISPVAQVKQSKNGKQIVARSRSKSKANFQDGEQEADSDNEERLVEMNKLKVKVKRRFLKRVVVAPRYSTSAISHAMSLKAEGEEVVEGVGILHALSDSDLGSLLDAEKAWQITSSDEEEAEKARKKEEMKKTGKGAKSLKTSTSSPMSSGQRRKGETDESRASGRSKTGKPSDGFGSDAESTASAESLSKRHKKGKGGKAHGRGSPNGSDDSDELKSKKKHRSTSRTRRGGRMSGDSEGDEGDEEEEEEDYEDYEHEVESSVGSRGSGRKRHKVQSVEEPKRYTEVDLSDPFADCPKPPVACDQQAGATEYYVSKGIGQIFETMLCRLVLEQPTRPLDYLINLAGHMRQAESLSREMTKEEEKDVVCPACINNGSSRSSQTVDISSVTGRSPFWSESVDGLPPVESNV